MKEGEIVSIKYVKENDERSIRCILPMYAPKYYVKAIDLTETSKEDCKQLEALAKEYIDYKESQIKKMYNFEDWLSHTGHDFNNLKWRTFKIDNILDEWETPKE